MLFETFAYGKSVPGFASLVVGLMVLGGVQLIMLGIMGEYIGKILSELKARPVYFVAEHMVKNGRLLRNHYRNIAQRGRMTRPDDRVAQATPGDPPRAASGSAPTTTGSRPASMPRSAIWSLAGASMQPR